MPSARRYNQPVVVEVRPEDVAPKSNMAPASPNKAVRFPVRELVTEVSRPLTQQEAWSLYHFEKHARTCRRCISPYQTVMNGGALCSAGHDLAQDVDMHVYHRHGQIYSTTREGHRDIRVEVPHDYASLLELLKARDRLRRRPKVVPVVTYDTRTLPLSYTSAPAVQPIEPTYNYTNAYVDTHRSGSHSKDRHSRSFSRYSTIVAGDDDEYETPRSSSKDEKRGSLYRKDSNRKAYRVEVRQPADSSSSRRTYKDRDGHYHN